MITESIGGDLYQVPIIVATGLEEGDYKVIVAASGSRINSADNSYTVKRVLYIDGIRIHNPLSDELEAKYYNKREYNAKISEVKELIHSGSLIYADIPVGEGNVTLMTGTTFIEDKDGDWVLTGGDEDTTVDLEAYLSHGPNNELYLNGTNMRANVIAFFVTPDINISANERTIQIGVHRKSDSIKDYNGDAYLVYGSTAQSLLNSQIIEIASGTEQYYTIDESRLEKGEDGRYLVMIGTNGSENITEVLSITNIKVKGYTISPAENEVLSASESQLLASNKVVSTLSSMHSIINNKEDDSVDDNVGGDNFNDTTDDVAGGSTEDTSNDTSDNVTGGSTEDSSDDTTDDVTDDTSKSPSFDLQSLMIGIATLCAAVLIIIGIASFIKKEKKGER